MLIYCVVLMLIYQNWSWRAILYSGVHGSYGLIWLFKDFYFPDKSWQRLETLGFNLVVSSILMGYYSIPFTAISNFEEIGPGRVLVVLITYLIGVALMLCADAQKTFTLKIKKGLINSGIFYNCRNPNYFGEILIYNSFALMAQNYKIYCFLYFVWFIFVLRMILKDKSLYQKNGAQEYFQRSGFLLPLYFKSKQTNIIFYSVLLVIYLIVINF